MSLTFSTCAYYTHSNTFSTYGLRCQCGVPVIIEGETGVGKTALVEMLSKLWNHSQVVQWKKQQKRLLDFMRRNLGELGVDVSDTYQVCHNLRMFSVSGRMMHIIPLPFIPLLAFANIHNQCSPRSTGQNVLQKHCTHHFAH